MIGHKCTGGGAAINNSPINIHIHIYSEDEAVLQKIRRVLYEIAGKRHIPIENASSIPEGELQRIICRELKDR